MNALEPRQHRKRLSDLVAFAEVAAAGSFTKAAARLGVSQSALSHLLRRMEADLGVRLLSRSTRSVAPTVAGEALLARLTPALDDIEGALLSVQAMGDSPSGPLRITTFKLAAQLLLWPILPRFAKQYPRVELELHISDERVDIIAGRFDAGVRFAGRVDQDMVGLGVGPPLRYITVASPDYLRRFGTPTSPAELQQHHCLHYRLSGTGERFPWRFRAGAQAKMSPLSGPLTSTDSDTLLQAAIAGLGIVQLYDGLARPALQSGELVQVLADCCPADGRLMLFHPSRRQVSAPLQALIRCLQTAGV